MAATDTKDTKIEGDEKPTPPWMTMDKDSDTKTPVPTEKTGKIPKWLNGDLYRNGSGVFCVGEQNLEHIFDGFAVIQRFLIHDGEVKYQSRILDSDSWVKSCKANRLVVSQFSTYAYPDPCKSMFDKMMSYLLPMPIDTSDNTAVNVVEHGDKLYAISDLPLMNEIDPDTLTKKSMVDLRDLVAVHMATAHPHVDTDGTMYNYGTSFNPKSAHCIIAIPPKQPGAEEDVFRKASLVTSIPSRYNMHISYSHSFGMTEQYFILLEQPVAMSIMKVMTVNWRRDNFASCMVKFPEEKTLFHVIRRSDGQPLPVTFEADPFFCFHFINCYEMEEHLVVDMCCFDDINVMDSFILKNMLKKDYMSKNPSAGFRRYVLPTNVTEADADVNLVHVPGSRASAHMTSPGVIHCTPDHITDDKIIIELPGINYNLHNGKKYRYAYGISMQTDITRLVKVDLEQRKAVYWQETGYSPGEPIFVAKPDAKAEDDGVLLSAVLSELPDCPSFLLVLDAKTFKEIGRAITPCDVKMANSFHGIFLPDKK